MKFIPRPFRELPRPTRVRAMQIDSPVIDIYRRALAGRYAAPLSALLNDLRQDSEIGHIVERLVAKEGGNHGSWFMLMEFLFEEQPNAIFELDERLVSLLIDTDFSSEHPVPASYCRLPSNHPIFIHLPSPPSSLNVQSPVDALPLSGYYLREVSIEDSRMIEIVVVSQPPTGVKNTDEDNFIFGIIPIHDETIGLRLLFEVGDQISREITGKVDAPEARARMAPHIEFLAKVLCYLGMRDVRRDLHAERTEALAAAARLGPRKRDPAIERARKLYDYTRISAPPAEKDTEDSGTVDSKQIATHHRRGHFRMAHVGQGRLERRVVWVRPTIVGLPGAAPQSKTYRVS